MNLSGKIALKETEFNKLSRFIYDGYGIKLPLTKKTMLEGRLQVRLQQLQLKSFREYYDFVSSPNGKKAVVHMVDRVSTNKTDFFREAAHFEFLTQVILPQHVQQHGTLRPLKLWSAASSSGEEVYTTCMVIEEFNRTQGMIDYTVHGTDISSEILKKATAGVYSSNSLTKLPLHLKERYFLRSKDRSKKLVRVVPELRKKVSFSRLNLMQPYYGEASTFDVVFCRNVLIYFDRKTQEAVVRKQCQTLKKGGYFFLGHSESINGMDLPLQQLQPTIYQKI